MMIHPNRMTAAALLAAVSTTVALPASATTFNWILGADGQWNIASNWDTVGFPDAPGHDANITTGNTVTLPSSVSVRDLTLGSGDGLAIDNNVDLRVYGTITNDGQINQNGTVSTTDLRIEGDVTLSGTGTWTMAGSSSGISRMYSLSGATSVLTNDTDHTIEGGGNIGVGLMGLINEGTITANDAVNLIIQPSTVVVDGASANFWNQGTLQATDGAVLDLRQGTYRNETTTIQAVGAGSQVWLNGSVAIVGGTIETTSGGQIIASASRPSFTNVTNEADFNINNNIDVALEGTFTNNATVSQNGTVSTTNILLRGSNVTINGNGSLTMDGVNNGVSRIFSESGSTSILTNGANHTIHGGGSIGVNLAGVNNLGTIIADDAVSLLIDPSSVDVDGNGANFWNQGTLQATSGANLILNPGIFRNDTSIDAVGTDSTVTLAGSAQIIGGTLNSSGGGSFIATASKPALTNVTNEADFNINNNVDVALEGTFTNNATVSQNGTVSTTDLLLRGDVTIDGNGFITMDGVNNGVSRIFSESGSASILTNGANHTIQGGGSIGVGLAGVNNLGTIIADDAVSLLINPSTVDVDGSGANFWNQGTLQATNGANLILNPGIFRNDTSIDAVGADSTVTLAGAAQIIGGTLNSSGGGSFIATASTPVLTDVTNEADFNINNNVDLALEGTFTNNATVSQNGTSSTTDALVSGDVTLNGNGTWTMNGVNAGVSRFFSASGSTSTLTHGASHTIQGTGSIGTNLMALRNQGTIIADRTSPIIFDPSTVVLDAEGANHINTGTILATGSGGIEFGGGRHTNEPGATIQIDSGSAMRILGGGHVVHKDGATLTENGPMTINSGGIFENRASDYSPGNGPGLVSSRGRFINTADATFIAEFAGPTGGTEHDQVGVNQSGGTATLDGTLVLELLDGYEPADYVSHELFIVNSGITGRFAEVENVDLGNDRGFAVTYTINRVLVTNAQMGDANLDGMVDLLDLDALGAAWQANGQGWQAGDFNGDGVTNLLDLDLLGSNWGFGSAVDSGSFAAALTSTSFSVPEPASIVLLGVGGAMILRRRR